MMMLVWTINVGDVIGVLICISFLLVFGGLLLLEHIKNKYRRNR